MNLVYKSTFRGENHYMRSLIAQGAVHFTIQELTNTCGLWAGNLGTRVTLAVPVTPAALHALA